MLKDENKKVEIGKTIDDLIIQHCRIHDCCMQDNKSKLVLDIIEAKHSDLIKDIEWERVCNECGGACQDEFYRKCIRCNGVGKITRPATIEEVLEMIKHGITTLELIAATHEGEGTGNASMVALTINRGRLKVKDDKQTT